MALFLHFGKLLFPRIALFTFYACLVSIGIVFEFAAFLGTIWVLRRVEGSVFWYISGKGNRHWWEVW